MSSQQLKKTRIELQDRKAQLNIANTGKELLEDRIGALLEAYSKQVIQLYKTRQKLSLLGLEARKSLSLARATDRKKLALAAMTATDSLNIEVKTENVMGINVPSIELISTGKLNSAIASSELIDRTIDVFRLQLEVLIDLASQELAVTELGREIRKTRHRFNALEKILIPELSDQIRQIILSLDEKERDELSKLRVFMKSNE
ncbi:MAG: V-type ATP synthase subunit D [Candidatus Heimdallarchaeota archaeon]|nr:V-type ATP synthase subunit D [Candidatus Heimdallarchaeota archaeon]